MLFCIWYIIIKHMSLTYLSKETYKLFTRNSVVIPSTFRKNETVIFEVKKLNFDKLSSLSRQTLEARKSPMQKQLRVAKKCEQGGSETRLFARARVRARKRGFGAWPVFCPAISPECASLVRQL